MAKSLGPRVTVWSPDGQRQGEHPLVEDRVTVGRPVPGHSPDIPLTPDPQAWISRLHCWFELSEGSWVVVDNGSVNGTVVDREGSRNPVQGRLRLQDKDEVLVLGYLVGDEPFWWRLHFDDPFATADGPQPRRSAASYVEYLLADAKLFVVEEDRRTQVAPLGRNRHKLVRYMASRNAANNGTPVTCTHDELITAVWGDPETWRYRTAYTAENLRDLIFELRKQLRPHERLIETVPGIGYVLHTRTAE
jgi:DNA-binding winged helix-turn-helix (wHTH) protein